MRPVVGYFCHLCQQIYADEDEAKVVHCSSSAHYRRYQVRAQRSEARLLLRRLAEAPFQTLRSVSAGEDGDGPEDKLDLSALKRSFYKTLKLSFDSSRSNSRFI